jgi:signal transduction histidine kinase
MSERAKFTGRAFARAFGGRRLAEAVKAFLIFGLACLVVGGAFLWGAFKPLDSALLDLRYRLMPGQASGDLVVVTIDPKSLEVLNTWPWSRSVHAELLDHLMSAGARQIAFDIDFSSRSTPEADARLAASLHAAEGRVVLPIFKQRRQLAGEAGDMAFTGPIEPFQREAKLGAVTIQPDPDGRIWHSRTSESWKGWNIPTIAGLLSGHARDSEPDFLIDYGIMAESVPQLSYIDVLRGGFDPALVAGKSVLIGASAVELGDRHAAPRHADLPGVLIQALAFESLVQNRAARDLAPGLVLLIALVIAMPAAALFGQLSWRKGLCAALTIGGATIAGGMAVDRIMGVHIPTATPVIGTAIAYLVVTLRALDLQALRIFNDQIEAAQRRALMKLVVESSFEGIVIAEEDGKVTMLNPTAATMLGCSADAALGQHIAGLIACTQTDGADDPLGIGTSSKFEAILQQRDTGPIDIEITAAAAAIEPIRHPLERRRVTRQIFIYTLHDVTSRKSAEEALRLASEAAMANSRAKTEFLANMSHELRTPLNAVIGFSEIIKEEMLGPVGTAQYRDYAKDINNAGAHLLEVINDILSVSRIELGEIDLNESEVDLARITQSTLRLLGPRAQEKAIEIDMQIAPGKGVLYADERSLRQMLLNVLSNAVKFTPEKGRIKVTATENHEGGIAVSVADTGIGIPADCIAKVTQPFFQADGSLERRFEGTGLGLSIVKGMMHLHEGRLEIESVLGQGTTVTMHFPSSRAIPRLAA